MTTRLEVLVYEGSRLESSSEFEGPVELGRQRDGTEDLFSRRRKGNRWRWVIARHDETTLSRAQVLLTPLADGQVRITNHSKTQPLRFLDRPELPPASSCDLALPVVVLLGTARTVRVQQVAGQTNSQLLMLQGLDSVLEALQTTADSADCFERVARALVGTVGFDAARVLLLEDGQWGVKAVQTAPGIDSGGLQPPSRTVLDRACREKKAVWGAPQEEETPAPHFASSNTSIAAPILSGAGEVVGALYGERFGATQDERPVTELDARLVAVLARATAVGLARLEQERSALSTRLQFEQFFTRELSLQLAAQPDLLQGRDSEVTLLFADIRGFSRTSERLGPAGTVEWIQDVMGALSECVLAEHGVLVEYIGDELIAMWGAPAQQPEHPQLACRAALAMLGQRARLNQRWQAILGEPIELGIGINTGVVRVGNIGTSLKFKYGPLGNTVNLASRVQGATKHLKCPLLITRATRERLGPEFAVRRLGTARVVNMAEPVTLYELYAGDASSSWLALRDAYEEALSLFERGQAAEALRILGPLLATPEGLGDGPSLLLAQRALNMLLSGPEQDPLYVLPSK
jgi:adenylate cyclase